MSELNHNNVRGEEQAKRMATAENLSICPFCAEGLIKIHKKPILHEIEGMFITESAFPYKGTSQHYMIIPKAHIKNISELSANNWSAVGALLKWVKDQNNLNTGGLFIRFGDMSRTGSSVAHLHFQIISGTKSDTDEGKESLKVKLGYK
jgi:diadenosine tetraphosphate (Ap4A) HIT family hydrolase